MRKFKCSFDGFEVDLDDPETYKHLSDDINILRDRMFREIGYSIVYMDYFPDRKDGFPKRKKKDIFEKLSDWYPNTKTPDKKIEINNCGYNQRQRVYQLIKNFSENENRHREDVMWYQEQIFLFEDEIENMC